MKKLLYIALIAFGMVGCEYEEVPKPPKTQYAKHLFSFVRHHIDRPVEIMNAASKLNKWYLAPTPEEREQIEDQFFPYHKLRLRGDTILLTNASTSPSRFRIFTRGKSLAQAGTTWEMILASDTIEIQCIDDKQWRLRKPSLSILSDQYDLIITLSGEFDTQQYYKVKGSGIAANISIDISCTCLRTVYKIDNELILEYPFHKLGMIEEYTPQSPLRSVITLGQITFSKEGVNNDSGVVWFLNQDWYTLTYKGFSERWNQRDNGYYIE